MKIAITGATGLLGSRIVELLSDSFEFLPISQSSCNITDQNQINTVIQSMNFDMFLHLAAYTNVDGAEKEKEIAYNTNVNATKYILNAVNNKQKKMIYISTDFIFDGKNPPYFEDSKPNPIGYYGQTKYEGEEEVKGKAMIVRPSYPYRKSFDVKKDFVRRLKELLEQGKTLTMINDSLITPTFIDDIAFALKHLINNYSPEIFHIVGSESMSPYESGKMIAKAFNLDELLVQPISYDEYFKDKAKRPRYSQIKSKKNDFYKMKGFKEGLKEMI